jgi:hypothetical protein
MRLFTTKNVFFKLWKGGSLAMSAGANPMIFRPIWLSCMHKCILLLVLRFLWWKVNWAVTRSGRTRNDFFTQRWAATFRAGTRSHACKEKSSMRGSKFQFRHYRIVNREFWIAKVFHFRSWKKLEFFPLSTRDVKIALCIYSQDCFFKQKFRFIFVIYST